MVRQWQELIYDNRYSHIDLAGSPDFVKLAEAYGVKGFSATNKEEARAAWEEALDHPGPAVVDFVVRKEENVYPMVTQGSTIDRNDHGGFGMNESIRSPYSSMISPACCSGFPACSAAAASISRALRSGIAKKPGLSRMVIVTTGDDQTLEQIRSSCIS